MRARGLGSLTMVVLLGTTFASGCAASAAQREQASTTVSELEAPPDAQVDPGPGSDAALAKVDASTSENVNEQDGATGSVCWSTREVNRNLVRLLAAETAGSDMLAATNELQTGLEAAQRVLASAAPDDLAVQEYQAALASALAIESASFAQGQQASYKTLAGGGGSLDVSRLPGWEEFLAVAENSPSCVAL
jgi:hypothetical protein